jgi:hypothetical protein
MQRFRISSQILQRLMVVMAAMVALTIALPAYAQTTGQLRVVVTDPDGLEVPNALVRLTGVNLIGGVQERTTGAAGEVLFPSLSPGDGYDVNVTHPSFGGVNLSNILISLGKTKQENIELQAAGAVQEIDVIAKRQAVNVEDTTTSQVLTKDFLQNLPTGRSYQSAVGMSVGVSGQGGNKNVGGGATNENTYMLDGANITDPVTGTFSVNFNFDAIEQIEIMLSGYMPEYGTSLGGIINIVTENGTNNLEFASAIFYNNGNWRPKMDARYTADGYTLAPTGFDSEFQLMQVSSKVSGPLLRDKAWFIISYQHDRTIIANTGIPQTRDYEGHYVLSKLTVQPASEHRFTGLLQLDPTVIDNLDQGDPFQKAEAQARQAQGGFLGQAKWQWFLSPDVKLETTFTSQKTYIEQNGVPCTHNQNLDYNRCDPGELEGTIDWESPARIGLSGAYDSVNYQLFYFDDRWRYTGSTKLSLVGLQDPFGGKHEVKIGLEGSQLIWDQIQGVAGNLIFVDLNEVSFDPQTYKNYYWLEYTGPIKFRTSGSQWNAFIQDSWKPVNNLTVNYGLRFDNFVMRNDLGDAVLAGNLFGPRLFAAWDPWGDQRTKVATGYGRFNDTGRLGTASFMAANTYGSHLMIGEYFADSSGWPVGYLNSTASDYDTDPAENLNQSHDNLRTPRVDEVILNLEREVIEDLALKSNMTGRFVRFQYEYDELNTVYDSDGSSAIGSRLGDPTITIPRLRTPALAKRDYFRWDLIAHKVRSKRWEAQGSYSYTQSLGSTTNSNSGSFSNDPQSQYNYGPLNTDLRHVFKSWGYWDVPTDPWKQTLGLAFEYYSGFPEERLYYAEDGFGGQWLRIRPRGTYLRFNPYWTAGLRLQQDFDVRKGKVVADLSATNIFNNRAPDRPNYGFIDSQNRLLTTSRQDPMRLSAGLRYEF